MTIPSGLKLRLSRWAYRCPSLIDTTKDVRVWTCPLTPTLTSRTQNLRESPRQDAASDFCKACLYLPRWPHRHLHPLIGSTLSPGRRQPLPQPPRRLASLWHLFPSKPFQVARLTLRAPRPENGHTRSPLNVADERWLVISLIIALVLTVLYVVQDLRPLPEPTEQPLEELLEEPLSSSTYRMTLTCWPLPVIERT